MPNVHSVENPAAGATEYDFIRNLVDSGRIPEDVLVQVLTQSRDDLIKTSFESLAGVHAAIVHVYNAVSPLWRQVVFPASMPAVVSGLKQGWAFAWRSLMAGELIGASIGKGGIGGFVDNARTFSDYNAMYAAMTLILIIGVIVDSIFNVIEKNVNRRRGLIDNAAA